MPPADLTSQARSLAAAAHAAGTRVAFGLPGGGANLTLIAACHEAGIAFVLMRSESAAVFAAAAYADVSGAPGLAICTRGPGLVAAALGLASARLDRQPVIVATRRSARRPDRDDGATRPGRLRPRRRRAGDGAATRAAPGGPRAAADPCPGDAPGDRRRRRSARRRPASAPSRRGTAHPRACDLPRKVRHLRRVGQRRRPLQRLPQGGTAPARSRRHRHGRVDPVELHAVPWSWSAPVVPLVDGTLVDALVPDDSGWAADGADWRRAMLDALDVRVDGLAPQDVVRAARTALPAGTIATVDAGARMLVAMPFWSADDPSEYLISSGLATMAFALPAAIGASFARDAPTVAFIGDDGLGVCLAEIETLARTRRDVRVIVLDDACLSLIRTKQAGHVTDAAAVTHGPVDFALAARALGSRRSPPRARPIYRPRSPHPDRP